MFWELLCASGVPHMQGLSFFRFQRRIRVYAKSALLEIAKTSLGSGVLCALTGLPFNEVYCASKFAIEGACESLAVLLRHFKIQ